MATRRSPSPLDPTLFGASRGGGGGVAGVVGRTRLQRPRDDGVAPVAGDKDDRQVGELGDSFHQLDAVGSRQHQVEQDWRRMASRRQRAT